MKDDRQPGRDRHCTEIYGASVPREICTCRKKESVRPFFTVDGIVLGFGLSGFELSVRLGAAFKMVEEEL